MTPTISLVTYLIAYALPIRQLPSEWHIYLRTYANMQYTIPLFIYNYSELLDESKGATPCIPLEAGSQNPNLKEGARHIHLGVY